MGFKKGTPQDYPYEKKKKRIALNSVMRGFLKNLEEPFECLKVMKDSPEPWLSNTTLKLMIETVKN